MDQNRDVCTVRDLSCHCLRDPNLQSIQLTCPIMLFLHHFSAVQVDSFTVVYKKLDSLVG